MIPREEKTKRWMMRWLQIVSIPGAVVAVLLRHYGEAVDVGALAAVTTWALDYQARWMRYAFWRFKG